MIQTAILIAGMLTILLMSSKHQPLVRAGFLIGLLHQPLWVMETWSNGQWGMLALTAWYIAMYARGFWNNLTYPREEKPSAGLTQTPGKV